MPYSFYILFLIYICPVAHLNHGQQDKFFIVIIVIFVTKQISQGSFNKSEIAINSKVDRFFLGEVPLTSHFGEH